MPSGGVMTGDTSFSMCIASGPFTPDADLSYKPWHALLDTIKTTKPAVLLLVSASSFINYNIQYLMLSTTVKR